MVPTWPLEALRIAAWSHVLFEETHPVCLGSVASYSHPTGSSLRVVVYGDAERVGRLPSSIPLLRCGSILTSWVALHWTPQRNEYVPLVRLRVKSVLVPVCKGQAGPLFSSLTSTTSGTERRHSWTYFRK
ncbi:hypothetical protein K443DRAFT_254766 [Laccaria amethystina LaAM-08-1]|uniref:Uncharacterized protein n=1 Tax=Laccaria amethystina LaAM-08-1 TaxID=1095629 RepID=A0A0C9XMP9_9AGAR|nr:hypothetical protein K443DRAFT_254766 [Laccaria amethystina LaAM-08-1]